MGAYSPAPVVTPGVHDRIVEQIIKPTIAGMQEEGHPYSGFLYAGLMIDDEGNPRVISWRKCVRSEYLFVMSENSVNA